MFDKKRLKIHPVCPSVGLNDALNNLELKVTVMQLPFFLMSYSSLHKNKHSVYTDYCVIKKDILLAVENG